MLAIKMQRKNGSETSEADWELSVTWDHPLVRAGFVPGHLLRESFGYSVSGWSKWVSDHSELVKPMNRRPWFNLAKFIEWTSRPENANNLPPTDG